MEHITSELQATMERRKRIELMNKRRDRLTALGWILFWAAIACMSAMPTQYAKNRAAEKTQDAMWRYR